MEHSQQILEPMCRACMCENQHYFSLYDEAADRPLTIYDMFASTLPQLPIQANDDLPKKICAACLDKLIVAHKFQQLCHASDIYMRSLLVGCNLSNLNDITDEEEEIKHIVMLQETTKLDNTMSTQDPLRSTRSIKVEINNEAAVLEKHEEKHAIESDWSDGDDRPIIKSENIKPDSIGNDDTLTFVKLEIDDVKMVESDLKTSLATEKNNKTDYLSNQDVHNAATNSEWSPADDDGDSVSDKSNGDDNYEQTELTKYATKTFQNNSKPSKASSETDVEEEIEKSSSDQKNKYPCLHCNASFPGNYKLREHSHVHDETLPYVCELCNYRYKTNKGLAQHKKLHEIPSPNGYKCKKCPKRFELQKSLMCHMRTHREHLFECDWCPQKFEKLARLKRHLRRHPESKKKGAKHNNNADTDFEWSISDENDIEEKTMLNIKIDEPTLKADDITNKRTVSEIEKPNAQVRRKYNFRCEKCEAAFTSNNKLQHHLRVHIETNPFVCEICHYRFKKAATLAFHTAVKHEKSPSEGYTCPECPRRFERSMSLRVHMQIHRKHVPGQLLFKCNLCPKKFERSTSLSKHIRLHPENQKFKCTLCMEAFGLSTQLDDHMNKHNGINTNTCEFCKKEFKHNSALLEHRRQHTNERPYLCPHCGKSFRTKTVLISHIKRHDNVKPFQCPECPKKFACRSGQSKHMEVHRNTKPFSCDICGSRFTRGSSLKKHKRTVHTSERPYKCDECSKAFACIYRMRNHKRTHTGYKPFQCKHCGRAFSAKSDLNKHIRIHIGEKTYLCDECPEAFKYQKELHEHQTAHYKQKMTETMKTNDEANKTT